MQYFADQYEALRGAAALVVLTDEMVFRNPDFAKIRQLMNHDAPIFDGRNLYEPKLLAELGIEYHCVGRNQ
jgi:UDPglucose 6-dehydrogenase